MLFGVLGFWGFGVLGQFLATFGPFATELKFGPGAGGGVFGVHFWANFCLSGQISNLAVVPVVGGVFGKVAVFPKVVVGSFQFFLYYKYLAL